MEQPTAEQALKKLEPLVGEWRMTATPPGGAHLIERSTVDLPETPDR
jgi:hypothetical protein